MKRAGVQDKVAMEISGHKTRAIFDRYNITDEGDIGNAADKLTDYFKNLLKGTHEQTSQEAKGDIQKKEPRREERKVNESMFRAGN